MSEPFIGEIRMFAGNFAPRGWAFCDGHLMSITDNTALFAILGTIYGGNGSTTFGVPDLRGRSPVGVGHGPGLSLIDRAEGGGSEAINMTQAHLPSHSHTSTFTGTPAPVSITADVATSTANAMVPPTSGSTAYLSATMATAGPSNVVFNGLFTETPPGTTKAQLGGFNGGPVTSAGTVNIEPTGIGNPIPVRNPYLGINFIIALEGEYPAHN
ncbi:MULTISPECIES: phage tail protein [Shewanella]|uniref:Phage tail protein n=1 Tax=Shewanella polaris TaxID=2588449 RepID=A0A4Y5YK61_9GAMM|nr:tail fiber protein [Shewanella polaris]QDE32883.1 phage tail protein [Shewanella polaris]